MINYKKLFPMFKNNPQMVYFDNSALTFKPKAVIKAGTDFYEKFSVSTRTADSNLGIKMSKEIFECRRLVANFVDALPNEVIFSSGTTESLNLAAAMIADIVDDGEIILSYYNHSSNIVPFLENFKNKNITIKYCETSEEILNAINKKTKIVALSQSNNTFNVGYNLKEIYQACQKNNAILVNDAAQAIAHEKVSLKYSDVIAFSANKLFGPTGMGALVIKRDLLERLRPKKWGGGQVQDINDDFIWTSKTDISKFEPGTANFAGIFQFKEAIEFMNKLTYPKINQIESNLANYLYDQLLKVNNIKIASNRGDKIILFNIINIPSQDVASYLGHQDIYVRSGVFCAHRFKVLAHHDPSYIRISISIYNSTEDVDKLILALNKVGDHLEFL
ncbi:aminotransferase class V-fold PLP-dependent enzyme [Mycoplasma phocoeninasale]|uniref:aminotransferase class V-fold PLP-dependent enzyme n=1 Tax=Mycoplasma phocoeninasale TaxID=2726117 RepID=UPI00197B9B5E|nr:aminotransferase class V-fold PLP-dependent enzyme [Mycoplasma phocoeninasale]